MHLTRRRRQASQLLSCFLSDSQARAGAGSSSTHRFFFTTGSLAGLLGPASGERVATSSASELIVGGSWQVGKAPSRP